MRRGLRVADGILIEFAEGAGTQTLSQSFQPRVIAKRGVRSRYKGLCVVNHWKQLVNTLLEFHQRSRERRLQPVVQEKQIIQPVVDNQRLLLLGKGCPDLPKPDDSFEQLSVLFLAGLDHFLFLNLRYVQDDSLKRRLLPRQVSLVNCEVGIFVLNAFSYCANQELVEHWDLQLLFLAGVESCNLRHKLVNHSFISRSVDSHAFIGIALWLPKQSFLQSVLSGSVGVRNTFAHPATKIHGMSTIEIDRRRINGKRYGMERPGVLARPGEHIEIIRPRHPPRRAHGVPWSFREERYSHLDHPVMRCDSGALLVPRFR
mmetsp:Transcript_7928/g.18701  ORF Transcript_7928/g.18701 Transcript_7928/m.18701 type:complete len:316 (+) Transcript_7928:510-1457(+)